MGFFSHQREVEEAKVNLPILTVQVNEATDLLETTIDPEVFFKSYDTLTNILQKLVDVEHLIYFSCDHSTRRLEQAKADFSKETNKFIDRFCFETLMSIERVKIDRIRQKKIEDSYSVLFSCFNRMSKENILRVQELYKCLKNNQPLHSSLLGDPIVQTEEFYQSIFP